ncbi:AAA family ATPase [Candidatus Micrarchaeota archaeon]|nr:AAA family ATPase [Candidatus Micrarchaeota archaeon]
MKRIHTGIDGLDELIEGGFPEGSSVLVSGGPGSGKSIFCMQYLYSGAKEYDEPGVYITMEEGPHNLWWNMQRFKWDLLPLEKAGKLKIFKFEPSPDMTDLEEQAKKIVEKAREMNARRVVIDSISAFSFWIENVAKIRYGIYVLIEELRKINCTSVLTSETLGGKKEYSRFGVEEFLVDGLVMLYFVPPHRILFVRKMRGTKHSMSVHPLEITEKGLVVNPREEILWEALRD